MSGPREEGDLGAESEASLDREVVGPLTLPTLVQAGVVESSGGFVRDQWTKGTQGWGVCQEYNQATYLKLYEDIQKFRADMVDFCTGKMSKAPSSWWTYDSVGNPLPKRQPTIAAPTGQESGPLEVDPVYLEPLVSVQAQTACPTVQVEKDLKKGEIGPVSGLLEQLDPQDDEIGLKEAGVIPEPPSPEVEFGFKHNISLTQEEIKKGRAALNWEVSGNDGETLDEIEIAYEERLRRLRNLEDCSGNNEYFVSYPFDEEGDESGSRKLQEEEENTLATTMSLSVCIRKRIWGRE